MFIILFLFWILINGKINLEITIIGLIIGITMGIIVIGFAFNDIIILPYILLLIAGMAFGIYRIYMLVLRIHMQYDKIEI